MTLSLNVSYVTTKNSFTDKPNEDAFCVDEQRRIYSVADGITRLRPSDGSYPVPSPASEASRIVVEESVLQLRDTLERDRHLVQELDLRNSLKTANLAIESFNRREIPTPDYGVQDVAGAAGIVGHIAGQTLLYAYIGDCLALYYSPKGSTFLTVNQTKGIEEYIRNNKGTPNLEQTIRREIRNNREHPLSWGALTGEEKALQFISSGSLELESGSRIIFSSDGLLHLIVEDPDFVRIASTAQLVQRMLELEVAGKARSDDKTVIVIDVT